MHDPRFDTLRDSPEISPWRSSGKLDCTRLTDGVSIKPRPSPIKRSPGAKAHTLGEPLAKSKQHRDARDRGGKTNQYQRPLGVPPDETPRAQRGQEQPYGCRGEDDSSLDRVVATHHLQIRSDDEGRPHQQYPLQVLRDQPEVRRPVSEQFR